MNQPRFDPGLTQQYGGKLRRAINRDGSFNVFRRGTGWRDIHPYLHLINMSWPAFFGLIAGGYVIANVIFAAGYFALAPGTIINGEGSSELGRFLNALYFSAQTITTVGYGGMSPQGHAANTLAALEAMCGWLGFALATGLLLGRVSRPSARIGFSENVLVAPYQSGRAVQFRVVNKRPNALMNLDATVLLMTVPAGPGPRTRQFENLTLERQHIYFFPLTWTIVHPIDEASPLWQKTAEDLEQVQAELLVLITAYDDTFSQTVHARYSYRFDEFVWNARFDAAFEIDDEGDMILYVDRVSRWKPQDPPDSGS